MKEKQVLKAIYSWALKKEKKTAVQSSQQKACSNQTCSGRANSIRANHCFIRFGLQGIRRLLRSSLGPSSSPSSGAVAEQCTGKRKKETPFRKLLTVQKRSKIFWSFGPKELERATHLALYELINDEELVPRGYFTAVTVLVTVPTVLKVWMIGSLRARWHTRLHSVKLLPPDIPHWRRLLLRLIKG